MNEKCSARGFAAESELAKQPETFFAASDVSVEQFSGPRGKADLPGMRELLIFIYSQISCWDCSWDGKK